jgi:hypothetical protein
MSPSQMIFWIFMSAALGFAVRFGGRDERMAAGCIAAAAVLSTVATVHNYSTPEVWVILVDFMLFCGLATISLQSRSFWPIWAAGLQLCGLAVHLAAARMPTMRPAAYADTLAIWSYLVIVSVALGTWLEVRRRYGQQ